MGMSNGYDMDMDYVLLDFEDKKPEEAKNKCPKCGKELKGKGAHFHTRACNGNTSENH